MIEILQKYIIRAKSIYNKSSKINSIYYFKEYKEYKLKKIYGDIK